MNCQVTGPNKKHLRVNCVINAPKVGSKFMHEPKHYYACAQQGLHLVEHPMYNKMVGSFIPDLFVRGRKKVTGENVYRGANPEYYFWVVPQVLHVKKVWNI